MATLNSVGSSVAPWGVPAVVFAYKTKKCSVLSFHSYTGSTRHRYSLQKKIPALHNRCATSCLFCTCKALSQTHVRSGSTQVSHRTMKGFFALKVIQCLFYLSGCVNLGVLWSPVHCFPNFRCDVFSADVRSYISASWVGVVAHRCSFLFN